MGSGKGQQKRVNNIGAIKHAIGQCEIIIIDDVRFPTQKKFHIESPSLCINGKLSNDKPNQWDIDGNVEIVYNKEAGTTIIVNGESLFNATQKMVADDVLISEKIKIESTDDKTLFWGLGRFISSTDRMPVLKLKHNYSLKIDHLKELEFHEMKQINQSILKLATLPDLVKIAPLNKADLKESVSQEVNF